jgi:hypothetical protein
MDITFDLSRAQPLAQQLAAAAAPSGLSASLASNAGAGGAARFNGANYDFGPGWRVSDDGGTNSNSYIYVRIDTNIPLILTSIHFSALVAMPGQNGLGAMLGLEFASDEAFSAPVLLGTFGISYLDTRNPVVVETDGPPEEGQPSGGDGGIILPSGVSQTPRRHFAFNRQLQPGGKSFIRLRAMGPLAGRQLWYFGALGLECRLPPSDELKQLAGAMPARGDNPIGKAARAVLVSKMKHTMPFVSRTLNNLFSGLPTDPQEAYVDASFGNPGLWPDLVVAAVCQRIYGLNSNSRRAVRIDKVRETLQARNQEIRSSLWKWYAYMLSAIPGSVKSALDEFSVAARQRTREDYMFSLTTDAWVNQHITMEHQGTWQDPEWELYHHWSKLTALGASPADIDNLILALSKKGLRIPDVVGAGRWTSWLGWYQGDIGDDDVSETTNALQAKNVDGFHEEWEHVTAGPGRRYSSF